MSGLIILHGCRTLQLSRGFNTLIDEADFDTVGRSKWYARGSVKFFYAWHGRTIGRIGDGTRKTVSVALHRVLTDAPAKTQVDHRNGDHLDNRRSNLRIVTATQNNQNRRRPHGVSRFKGVFPQKSKWRAHIFLKPKMVHLGYFQTQEEAARAYDTAAIEHFGEFACTNKDIYGDY